jgi:hypothetical protein
VSVKSVVIWDITLYNPVEVSEEHTVSTFRVEETSKEVPSKNKEARW